MKEFEDGDDMKKLYLVGGTMGVGKTTICQQLKSELTNSVFLDGDWCWDASPFHVTEETKAMVVDNICHVLNNFLHCSAYDNVIFCWVMHQQAIIDSIVQELDLVNCDVKVISLMTDTKCLEERLMNDIEKGIRSADVLSRSMEKIPLYQELNTIKIDTCNMSVQTIVDEIRNL